MKGMILEDFIYEALTASDEIRSNVMGIVEQTLEETDPERHRENITEQLINLTDWDEIARRLIEEYQRVGK